MELLAEQGEAGAAVLAALADDPRVEGLLLLHDLHPLDVDARIQRALDRVRPYLGSHAGGVQYLGVTDGVARLRLEGSCDGCPSSTVTVELAIRGAVEEAAPEVTEVVVEGMAAAPDPACSRSAAARPTPGRTRPARRSPGGWVTPARHRPAQFPAGERRRGRHRRAGLLRPRHAVCLPGRLRRLRLVHGLGTLNREELTCPACGAVYNVRLAGKGTVDPALHLDPLPLLADSRGVRVALPETVRSLTGRT